MLEATWPPPRPSQRLHVWMADCVFQMSNHINRGLHLHVGSLQFIFRSPECTNDDDTASIWQCVEDWAFRFFLVNTHYCWFVGDNSFTAAHGCFTLSMFPANSGFSFFFLSFSFDLTLKNTVLIKFSFWHRPPRVSLLRRRRKTGASEHHQILLSGRDARQEGWRGENHLYPSSFFFFTHFHFQGPPVAPHSALPCTGSRPAKCSSQLACDSGGFQRDAWIQADRKLVGRSIDYGGAESKLFAPEALNKGRLAQSRKVKWRQNETDSTRFECKTAVYMNCNTFRNLHTAIVLLINSRAEAIPRVTWITWLQKIMNGYFLILGSPYSCGV